MLVRDCVCVCVDGRVFADPKPHIKTVCINGRIVRAFSSFPTLFSDRSARVPEHTADPVEKIKVSFIVTCPGDTSAPFLLSTDVKPGVVTADDSRVDDVDNNDDDDDDDGDKRTLLLKGEHIEHTTADDNGADKLAFIRSQRGAPLLVHDEFVYRCERKSSTRTYWLCVGYKRFKCNARIICEGNRHIKCTTHYSHGADRDRIQKGQLEYHSMSEADRDVFLNSVQK